WAGDSLSAPPEELDAAIIFAPAGELVPAALRVLAKGGTVVCAGIHMSDIPSFPYELLWGERVLRSVANLTRADGERFLRLDPEVIKSYGLAPLPDALFNRTTGRQEAKRLTGSSMVPFLVTDDGEVIKDSKRIIEWARRHPAGAPAASG